MVADICVVIHSSTTLLKKVSAGLNGEFMRYPYKKLRDKNLSKDSIFLASSH